jgi:hypothetical protein
MSQPTFDQEDGGFTFTDEDFERRYYAPEENIPTSGAGGSAGAVNSQAVPSATRVRRSPNKFMRTLLRRRLASAAVRPLSV